MMSRTAIRPRKSALLSVCLLGATIPALAANHTRHATTPAKPLNKRAAAKPKPPLGQRSIDDERATQLQAALIRAGYLTGQPSGHWDEQTEAAMAKLQADNGWQTKLVPDSRAIIKIGLGPANDSIATDSTPLTGTTPSTSQ